MQIPHSKFINNIILILIEGFGLIPESVRI